MDEPTIRRLNQINRDFYAAVADSFDEARQQAWPGWERLSAYLTPPLSVLDVGCGNGRFGMFIAQQFDGAVRYHGMDSNPVLLDRAREALTGVDSQLEQRDIVEKPPDAGTYDLVALFGVLHHIPGANQRQQLMATLAQRVTPGGWLAFACWRFYEYERFRQRIVPWPADFTVESRDYLLDWRRGTTALRYCHYVDDAEHAALIAATGLTEVVTYRADGHAGDANCYSVLRKDFNLTPTPYPLAQRGRHF